jgi:hypothetical protein
VADQYRVPQNEAMAAAMAKESHVNRRCGGEHRIRRGGDCSSGLSAQRSKASREGFLDQAKAANPV